MNKTSLRGIFPPIPIPFNVDGELAVGALQDNLSRWSAYELAGFVVAGSSGEAALLEEDEKVRAWQAAREVIPQDRLMIAGVGCESTRATIALAGLANEAGADVALVVTPSYYHSLMSPDALSAYYHAVADASPIPIMVYSVPCYTNVDISAATVVALSRHPNIIGMKDSSGNLAKLAQVVQRSAEDFYVFTGAGGALLPGLAMGADGGILLLANLAPAACVEIFKLHAAGDWANARALQGKLIPLNTMVGARLGPPGLKAALDMLGYYGGPVRAPLTPPSDNDRAAIRAVLAEAGLYQDA